MSKNGHLGGDTRRRLLRPVEVRRVATLAIVGFAFAHSLASARRHRPPSRGNHQCDSTLECVPSRVGTRALQVDADVQQEQQFATPERGDGLDNGGPSHPLSRRPLLVGAVQREPVLVSRLHRHPHLLVLLGSGQGGQALAGQLPRPAQRDRILCLVHCQGQRLTEWRVVPLRVCLGIGQHPKGFCCLEVCPHGMLGDRRIASCCRAGSAPIHCVHGFLHPQ